MGAVGEGGSEPLFRAAFGDGEAFAEVADGSGEAADGKSCSAGAILEAGELGAGKTGMAQDAICAPREIADECRGNV